MKYQIQYFYQTGNSFGSEDAVGILELEWDSLDIAKENLRRIKEHYTMVNEIDSAKWEIRMNKRKSSYTDIASQYQDHDWFAKHNDRNMWENCIVLYTDAGNPFQFWCPWCGYFERLHSAKIITTTPIDIDMEINF